MLLLRTQNGMNSQAPIRSLYPVLELAPNLEAFSTMKLSKEKIMTESLSTCYSTGKNFDSHG